ncbi:MAG: hypothetical protein HKN48_02925 [Flavobacteriaceae bacterium]|nr:hypothetical protein [Flavobacteriaceae bacterium]
MKVLIRSIYPYLFLFFCFVIPLDKYATAVPNIVLIALLATFPFAVKKEDFQKLMKKEVLFFAGLVAVLFLNSLLFHDFMKDVTILKKVGSALLLLVLFIPLEKTENLKKTLIISVLLCIVICLFNLYGYYVSEGAFNFSSGSVINDVLIIDRLYLGFLCVLSIVASIALIGNRYNEYNKWYFANIVFCVGFVLLISSRIAVLLLLLLFLLKIFYTKGKKEYILFFIGVIALVFAAFLVNKNLNDRFFYAHSTQKDEKSYIELFMQWEPRAVIWECNYKIITEGDFTVFGSGFYNTKDKLVNCYEEVIDKEPRKAYFVRERFNPHNQYVDFLLSSGILPMLLYIVVYGMMFMRNRRSYYKTALLISVAAFAFIESHFHRQMGAYIFAIILIMAIYPLRKPTPKSIEEV